MRTRRAVIALACTACVAPLASAQTPAFAVKPITIVIGSTPGSATGGLERAVGAPNVRQVIGMTGQEAAFMGPEELAKFQLDELVRWSKIIRAAGIEAE